MLQRESYREGSKVRKRTLANLSELSAAQSRRIRAALRGEALQPVAQSIGRTRPSAVAVRVSEDRHDARQRLSKPLWEELHAWLQLERARVAGGAIGQAIDYSLKNWQALTLHLSDGQVPIDNNQQPS